MKLSFMGLASLKLYQILVRVETLTLIIYNMIYILIDALYRIETNGLYE